jgi:cation diffusion facilitator family transporter
LSQLDRAKKVRQILWGILIVNWVIASVKVWFGLHSHTAAVTADGLHGFIDGAANIVGLIGVSIASQPADEDHPYGHGKFEALSSLGIGMMVGMAMLELGSMAFDSLLANRHPDVDLVLILVMLGTLVSNVVVTTVERRAARRLNSSLLMADASHTFSDLLVTAAVLVSLALIKVGFPRADGIAALVILVFVAHTAYDIIRQAVGILSDSVRLDPARVGAVVDEIAGVQRCTSVRSRGMEGAVYVDLKIEVDPELTTAAAHLLADEAERRIAEAFPEVVDVMVHVEPGTRIALAEGSAPSA